MKVQRPEVVVESLALFGIREVQGSNLGSGTNFLELRLSKTYSVPQSKCCRIISN